MTPFAIALIVASPFVYWLLRRRTRNREDSQPAERSLAPDIIDDESETEVIEVEHGGDRSVPGQLEVDAAEDARGAAETAHVDAGEVNTNPETLDDPDKATYPETDSQVPSNDNRENTVLGVAEPVGQLLSAQVSQNTSSLLIRSSEEYGHVSALLGRPHLGDPVLDAEVADNTVAAPAITDQELQSDRPEAESIEFLAPSDTEEPRRATGESGNGGPSQSAERPSSGGAERNPPRYRPPVQKPPRPVPTRPVDRTTARASSILKPGESYEYTSGAPLNTPTGMMGGAYQMESESGERFDIEIPTFSLDRPNQDVLLN